MTDKADPCGSDSSAELGPVGYLYHDAATPADAHPWLHSTMLVLAADRRPGLRGETELFTRAQVAAAVEKEREKLRAAQAAAVMPLIGPLLDAWECCSQAVREEHPELDKQLRRINRAMEDAGDGHNY